MLGFNWIVNKVIAGAAQPGLYADWQDDLDFIKDRDIDYILSLTEQPLEGIENHSDTFGYLHLPIRDMDAPLPRNAYPIMLEMKKKIDEGHRFLIHCKGGVGRTGMIAAAYLSMTDETPTNAIAKVRSVNPFYIQTKRQELFVTHFCTYMFSQK